MMIKWRGQQQSAGAMLEASPGMTWKVVAPMRDKNTASPYPNEYERLDDGTIRVYLTQGQYAVIDAADFERVCRHRWFAYRCKHARTFYARSHMRHPDGRAGVLHMHRLISDVPDGVRVDHWDGDGLNNRRGNLRPATDSQNVRNGRIRSTNVSGYKGVSWKKPNRKWVAQIHDGTKRHLGLFNSPEEAARAYDDAARRLHGAFARLNFPQEGEQQA